MNCSGNSRSIWHQHLKDVEPFKGSAECEVCVVGAGIAGLSVAYGLARQGLRVIVLDDGTPGCGETGRTTAHLSYILRERYTTLAKQHGQERAVLIQQSHQSAIDFIEEIVTKENIQCDFSRLDGFLFAGTPKDEDLIESEHRFLHEIGLSNVEIVDRVPEASAKIGRSLRIPLQAQFQPLDYLNGLVAAIKRRKGCVYSLAHVSKVELGTPATVFVSDGLEVRSEAVVIATNSPVIDVVAMHTKQAAYRTYAIAAPLLRTAIRPALYWDTLDPYHYVRTYDGYLIAGGEDHKTGQADDAGRRFDILATWSKERFEIGPVAYSWSGQVIESVDGVGFIGQNPGDTSNVFIVTGDSGNGMTNGSLAGLLIPDLILARDNAWAEVYDPSRKPWHAASGFLSENMNVAAQYAEWLLPTNAVTEAIKPGEGTVLQSGFSKIAVFRDESGDLHRFSARCPHLGCVVHWNHHERTWDCPCHGSRFEARGAVMNGPAITGLTPVDDEQEKLFEPQAKVAAGYS